jgi:hypothetical protein
MDYRRSAFVEEWYFGEGADTKGKVVWFLAPPGAKVYKGPTPFRSLDTVDKFDLDGSRVGPVPGKRYPWSNGKTIGLYTGQGPPCGEQWFAGGIPSPPPPNPVRNVEGVPECCVPMRFSSFGMSAQGRMGWNYHVPVLHVRQVKQQSLTGDQFSIFWGPPTQPLSGLVAVVSAALPVAGPFDVVSPAGWTTIQSATYDGKGWQLWLFASGLPSRLSDGPFLCPHAALGIVAIEVADVVGEAIPDILRIQSFNSNDFFLAGGSPSWPYEAQIGAVTGTSFFAGIFPAYNQGETLVPVPSIPSECLVEYRITSTGESVAMGGSHETPSPGTIVGLLTIPSMSPPGHGIATLGAYGPASWQSTMVAFTSFALTGTAAASWAGVAASPSSFAADALSDVEFGGSIPLGAAFAMDATSLEEFIATGLVGEPFGMSAVADAEWTGITVLASPFAASGSAAASWVGTGLLGEPFAMSATAAASWTGLAVAFSAFADSATALASWVGATASTAPSFDRIDHKTQSTGTSIAVTYGSAAAAGDIVFLGVGTVRTSGATPTVTAPAGWTDVGQATSGTGGKGVSGLCWKVMSGGETASGSYGFSNNCNAVAFAMRLKPGSLVPTQHASASASLNTGSGPTVTGGTVSSSAAVAAVVAMLHGDSGSSFGTPASGFIIEDQLTAPNMLGAMLLRITSATGTFTPSAQSNGGVGESGSGISVIIQ